MIGKKKTPRQQRPSPSASAALQPIGTRMKGNDGRTYIVISTSNGTHRWVVHRPSGIKREIRIVDNGGKPFVVKLTSVKGPGVAHVWRMKGGKYPKREEREDTRELWRSIEYKKVFIGKDPSENNTKKMWWHGGNTLLLEVADKKYIAVTHEIFTFTTSDTIVKYVSIMGNSATPYPYAVGSRNTYLISEKVYVPNDVLQKLREFREFKTHNDPYEVYYSTDWRNGKEISSTSPAMKKAKAKYDAVHAFQRVRILHPRI